jgi:L-arabinose isomerase
MYCSGRASGFIRLHGTLDEAEAWQESQPVGGSGPKCELQWPRPLGVLGHYYNGMLDIYSDLTLQSSTFGCHIQHLEMDELKRLRDGVTPAEIEDKIAQVYAQFEVLDECPGQGSAPGRQNRRGS